MTELVRTVCSKSLFFLSLPVGAQQVLNYAEVLQSASRSFVHDHSIRRLLNTATDAVDAGSTQETQVSP